MTKSPFTIGTSPTLKIRGIIAARAIKQGELIEKCPIILVPKSEWVHLKQTVLWKYYYEWNKSHHAIVLGYGSLINHSYTPNSKYTYDYRGKYLLYKAIKPIRKGEEILVNYNYEPNSKEKLPQELTDFNKHKPS